MVSAMVENISKELFEKYYVEEDRSREEVAELFGIKPFQVSIYANEFNLKKLSAAQKLDRLKLKYPQEILKKIYDELGYVGTLTKLELKPRDLDNLVKEYQIGKRGKQARIEASIDPEELKRFYIEENHSFKETAEHFNCTGVQLRPVLNKLGIVKDRKQVLEVSRRSCLEKYGVESVNQVPEIKEKKRKVSFERYGVNNPMQRPECRKQVAERLNTQEIIDKRTNSLRNRTEEQKKEASEQAKSTMVEKYGEDYKQMIVSKSRDTLIRKYGVPYSVPGHEKMKQTNLERYGVEQYSQSEEGKERIKQTKLEKYGGYFNKEKITETKLERYGDPVYNNREKARETNKERYGVDWFCIHPDCYCGYKNDSKPNLAFAKILEENGIEFEREFPVGNRSYDFKVGNVLVEVDPWATHNSTWGIKGGEPKSSTYHLEKTQLARDHGLQCMHIWDWDDQEKIVKMFLPKERIFARKCTLKELTQQEVNGFLDKYHLQGRAKMQTVCLGLYYNDDLIQVMTFGKPRFNKHFEWELIRLCTKTGFLVIGGSEKLFKHFIQEYCPESIISYCDMSKFSGRVYTQLGMIMKSCNNPSRHWYNPETGKQLTDNSVRKLGFDKLCNADYGKGTSNDSLLREYGWVELWDAGQAVYSWQKT